MTWVCCSRRTRTQLGALPSCQATKHAMDVLQKFDCQTATANLRFMIDGGHPDTCPPEPQDHLCPLQPAQSPRFRSRDETGASSGSWNAKGVAFAGAAATKSGGMDHLPAKGKQLRRITLSEEKEDSHKPTQIASPTVDNEAGGATPNSATPVVMSQAAAARIPSDAPNDRSI